MLTWEYQKYIDDEMYPDEPIADREIEKWTAKNPHNIGMTIFKENFVGKSLFPEQSYGFEMVIEDKHDSIDDFITGFYCKTLEEAKQNLSEWYEKYIKNN